MTTETRRRPASYYREYYRRHRDEVRAKERARYYRNREAILQRHRSPRCRERMRADDRRRWAFRYQLRLLARMEVTMQAMEKAAAVPEYRPIGQMTTEELVAEFNQGWRLLAAQLRRQADLLAEIERRGGTVDGDRPLLQILHDIKAGRLLAEVVVRFAEQPQTLNRVRKLNLATQRQALNLDDAGVRKLTGYTGTGRRPAHPVANGTAAPTDEARPSQTVPPGCASAANAERLVSELDDTLEEIEALLLDAPDLPAAQVAALAVELERCQTTLAARVDVLATVVQRAQRQRIKVEREAYRKRHTAKASG